MKSSVGQMVSGGGRSFKKAILEKAIDPAREFVDRGIVKMDWEKAIPGNKKFPYQGRKIVSSQMDDAEKMMVKAIKNSPVKNNTILSKKELVQSTKDFARLITDDVPGSSVDDAAKVGREIVDEFFPQGSKLTPAKALEIKRKMLKNSIKKNGQPYSAIEKQVRYRLGMKINSVLKKAVPEVADGLRSQEVLFSLREMMDAAFVKEAKNNSQTLLMGLSPDELARTASDVYQTAFTLSMDPIAGTAVGLAKAPSILGRMVGAPKTARTIAKGIPSKVKTGAKTAGSFLKALGIQGVNNQ